MARRPGLSAAANVRRALKGAAEAGWQVGTVEVLPDGTVRLVAPIGGTTAGAAADHDIMGRIAAMRA